MKKLGSLLTAVLLVLSLAACGSKTVQNAPTDALQPESGNTEAENTAAESVKTGAGKKALVVYFSATGNTKQAAEYIAEVTGGDLFELTPAEPYETEDLNWNDENSRVVYEHNHPDAQAVALVSSTVSNFNEYDTVFIGYPIWWGAAAWPVNGFVKDNDFTGKTVIPFCTSASSGIGESGKLLQELAGTGNWLEGQRFSSGVTKAQVEQWVQSLGY